ncbi:glycosyltransferase [Geomonas propionica]|uniref:glycosyltransferase n=1 Tax=Geomonas propionica TaxID=2798582 RepID=UPI0022A7D207|nr:glycosyltransferase [Geomonas propionica]
MSFYIFGMIKVCHIISGDLWAGAEVMACHLLRELVLTEELRLYVLLLNDGRLAAELREAGLSVTVFDESRCSFTKLAGEVRNFLKKDPPDLIHSHRYKENLLALMGSAGSPRTRLIATQHGLPEENGLSLLQGAKVRANFFLMSRFFDRTVAVSRDIRDHLVQSLGFRDDRVAVIHNGVPIPSENVSPASCVAGFRIGSSGRLCQVKDYPLMVAVASIVCAKRQARFLLAGEGSCRGEIAASITARGLDGRFVLAGHLDDMDSFYRGLDLYLNTSRHEGIPMTILEAMARGVPVVAPAVGGDRRDRRARRGGVPGRRA